MKRNELTYEQLEGSLAQDYMAGKITYEEMINKLANIIKHKELSELLDSIVIIFK